MIARSSQSSLRYLPLLLSSSAVLLGLAQGCNHQDSSNEIIYPQQMSDYQRASCDYSFDQGGAVDSAIASAREVRTVYFGKKFDFAPVHAVQHASALATVEFFNTQGVRIFQIPKSVSSCNLFASVTQAPQDFQSYWEKASGGDTSKGTIIGLYIEKGAPEVPSASASSLIGVREDAYRWVVVHEFMHHQFEVMATAQTQSPSKLKTALKEKLTALQSASSGFDDQQDLAHFKVLANAFLAASPLLRELVTRYPLEEVTIETFLQKEYQAGNFDFMPFIEDSSNAYIASSAAKARGLLEDFASLGKTLSDTAFLAHLSEADALNGEHQAITGLNDEISRTLLETGAGWTDSPLFADLVELRRPQPQSRIRCAHERETQQISEEVRRVSAKVRKTLAKSF